MQIELNIFTNSTLSSPSTDLIMRTHQSVLDVFGEFNKTNVWVDRSPNLDCADEYINNLNKKFDNVYPSTSLPDGYISAVQNSESTYMFMLEHDWEFRSENILHSLKEIINEMNLSDIWHLRFNKRANEPVNTDTNLRLGDYCSVPFCYTSFLSNIPHIIDREKYIRKALPYLKRMPGNKGLENKLKNKGLIGAIYGGMGHGQAVIHLDGSNSGKT